MEIEELKLRMREANIMEGYQDEETVHVKIDELLLEYVDDDEVRELYYEVDKWYA